MPGTHSSAPEEKSENLVAGADPTDYNVEAIAKLERDALLERNAAERISDRITRIVGSLTFIVVHTALFVVWKVLERAE